MSAPRRRLVAAMALVGTVGCLAALAGLPVRATYGAQTSADEPQYLLTAISIAEDASLDIADELAEQRWRAFHEAPLPQQTRRLPGGRQVSPHDPLLPLLLAGPVAVAGWVGAKAFLTVLAGVLAAGTVWVAVRRLDVEVGWAATVVGLFAVSAPLAVYGTQVYPELPAALAVLLGVAATTGALRPRDLAVVGAAVVALPWLAAKYVPVAAAVAGVALVRLGRQRRMSAAAALAAALALAGVVYLAAHQAWYGGWTAYAAGDHFVPGEFSAVGFTPNYLGRSRRLLGLLVDRSFGLAAWQPAWLLTVPAVGWLLAQRPRGWAALTAPAAAGWLTATFLALTMHGWWFPGRQVIVIAPLLVLMCVWWTASAGPLVRRGTIMAGGLGVWSYGWLLAGGLQGQLTWIVDFAATADPWYRLWRYLLPDYLQMTPTQWALHGCWLAALAAVVVLASRPPTSRRALTSLPSSRLSG